MKRGCFIKTVVIGTILLAVAIYLIKYQFKDFFLEKGKTLVMNEIEDNWDEDLSYVRTSPEKDSLKTLLKEFVLQLKKEEEILEPSEQSKKLMEDVVKSFEDSLISSDELKKITELFRSLRNEEPKSY